jgi:peptidoglycan/xylan/chitin deacetylase (PgdA/CDA1 family)
VYREILRAVSQVPHREFEQTLAELIQECGTRPADNQVLPWSELRRLQKLGVSIGAHTRTHPPLDRIDVDTARGEILGGCEDLRRELREFAPVFAYPGGHRNEDVVELVRSSECEAAVTTSRGVNRLNSANRFLLRRINVGRGATLAMLRAQLSLPPLLFDQLARFWR